MMKNDKYTVRWNCIGSLNAVRKIKEIISPVLSGPERVQFKGTTQCDDQQEPTHQTADQSCCDHLPGHRGQTVSFITAIQTVLLTVAPPRLKDAQVGSAVKVSGLTIEAVFLIWSIWALLLVVTSLRGRVTSPAATLAGILARLAQGAVFLISASRAVPVAITALQVRITALICTTRMLARKAIPLNLQTEKTERIQFSFTPIKKTWFGQILITKYNLNFQQQYSEFVIWFYMFSTIIAIIFNI